MAITYPRVTLMSCVSLLKTFGEHAFDLSNPPRPQPSCELLRRVYCSFPDIVNCIQIRVSRYHDKSSASNTVCAIICHGLRYHLGDCSDKLCDVLLECMLLYILSTEFACKLRLIIGETTV
jgi:hypothetical protein